MSMGLLDFDDKEILKKRGIMPANRPKWQRRKMEDNFEELQPIGHGRNSMDFEDSPFADRQKLYECPNGYHVASESRCPCEEKIENDI